MQKNTLLAAALYDIARLGGVLNRRSTPDQINHIPVPPAIREFLSIEWPENRIYMYVSSDDIQIGEREFISVFHMTVFENKATYINLEETPIPGRGDRSFLCVGTMYKRRFKLLMALDDTNADPVIFVLNPYDMPGILLKGLPLSEFLKLVYEDTPVKEYLTVRGYPAYHKLDNNEKDVLETEKKATTKTDWLSHYLTGAIAYLKEPEKSNNFLDRIADLLQDGILLSAGEKKLLTRILSKLPDGNVKRRIYSYTPPEEKKLTLEPVVLYDIERLGGIVNSRSVPDRINYIPVPPAIQDFLSIEWPPRNKEYLQVDKDHELRCWSMSFDVSASWLDPEETEIADRNERPLIQIGEADGGNYYLLMALDDNSHDPKIFIADHYDPEQTIGEGIPLSEFLKTTFEDTVVKRYLIERQYPYYIGSMDEEDIQETKKAAVSKTDWFSHHLVGAKVYAKDREKCTLFLQKIADLLNEKLLLAYNERRLLAAILDTLPDDEVKKDIYNFLTDMNHQQTISSGMTPVDILFEFLSERGWNQGAGSKSDSLHLHTMFYRRHNQRFRIDAVLDEDDSTIQFSSVIWEKIPTEKLLPIFEFIVRGNQTFNLGHLELDIEQKLIRYTQSSVFAGTSLNHEILTKLLYPCISTSSIYWPALKAIIEDGKSPIEAISLIKKQ